MFEWDSKRLGKEIKDLRMQAGLSQSELAEDIISQGHISNLEKGKLGVYLSAKNLFRLAERLGVPVDYFYHVATYSEINYANTIKDKITELINIQDYQMAYQIIKREKKSPVFFKNRRNKQFLLWQEGIALFYIDKQKDQVLLLLNEALKLTNCNPNISSEQDIEILNSIGIIHYETNDQINATATYNKALRKFDEIPYISDPSIKTKLKYNLAKSQTGIKNYQSSIKTCLEGIKWAATNHSLKSLGKLHYQIAYNHLKIGELNDAYDYFTKAKTYFELLEDHQSLKKANEMLIITKQKLVG
ncbi:helix-turn-helix domain-containing protein [Bacillus sp. DJP31]|uniref:helix-turn-helix domain-containing protein n=1 Tax=Bacillus sp. DJP31 TaxID=3409789 RepID=UPI003BB5A370